MPAPSKGEQSKEYNMIDYVRRKCKARKLSSDDLQLVSLDLRILGTTAAGVFGSVETCDGGYRWTFVPAGVEHHSKGFEAKDTAEAELRWIQLRLYPEWARMEGRAAHLEFLVRQRQSEPQLISLLNTASLAAARGPLSAARWFVVLVCCHKRGF